MKIAVRMTNWVGDCLMATPALRKLRQIYADAEIHVVVAQHLVTLFENNPHINQVIGFEFRRQLLSSLKKQRYDKIYVFPRSWDSALIPFLARIPERIGYANQGRGLLLTTAKKRSAAVRAGHQSGAYWNLVDGEGEIPSQEKRADLVLDPCVELWAEAIFKEKFPTKKVIGIAPGATYGSAKMWRSERFAALAQRLLKHADLSVLFLGGFKEGEWIHALMDKTPGAVSFAGKTNLQEAAALMQRCAVVLANDSGPMHLAAAMKVPLVVLFGPTKYEATGPMGEHTLIHKRVACSPCLLRHCPIDHRCMEQITVDRVYEAIVKKT